MGRLAAVIGLLVGLAAYGLLSSQPATFESSATVALLESVPAEELDQARVAVVSSRSQTTWQQAASAHEAAQLVISIPPRESRILVTATASSPERARLAATSVAEEMSSAVVNDRLDALDVERERYRAEEAERAVERLAVQDEILAAIRREAEAVLIEQETPVDERGPAQAEIAQRREEVASITARRDEIADEENRAMASRRSVELSQLLDAGDLFVVPASSIPNPIAPRSTRGALLIGSAAAIAALLLLSLRQNEAPT